MKRNVLPAHNDSSFFLFQSLIPNKGPAPSLPMPNITAPPPPSEEGFDEPSYGIALYDFEPIQDGDLSLRVSQSIFP